MVGRGGRGRGYTPTLKGSVVTADAVKIEIHGAEAGGGVHNFDAGEGLEAELALLVFVELPLLANVVVRRKKKAAGTAGWIVNGFSRLWTHDVHHAANDGTG